MGAIPAFIIHTKCKSKKQEIKRNDIEMHRSNNKQSSSMKSSMDSQFSNNLSDYNYDAINNLHKLSMNDIVDNVLNDVVLNEIVDDILLNENNDEGMCMTSSAVDSGNQELENFILAQMETADHGDYIDADIDDIDIEDSFVINSEMNTNGYIE